MATKIRGATALTGGGAGAVDAISGAVLADGDIVVAVYDGQVYTYVVDADSGLAESSPHIIAPDVSAGDKRLILQSMSDEIDVLAIYGDGVNRTRTAIEAAKTALGAANKYTFLIRRGTWTIDDDLTITSNLTLKVVPGALLQIASGKTLTIGGPFEAGLYQVFSHDNSDGVVFSAGSVDQVRPEWFGAVAEFSTHAAFIPTADSTLAIQSAVNSIGTTGGRIKFSVGSYKTLSPILLENSHIELLGSGNRQTRIVWNHNTYGITVGLSGSNKINYKIADMSIWKGGTARVAGSAAIRVCDAWGVIIDNVEINSSYYGVLCDGNASFGADVNVKRSQFDATMIGIGGSGSSAYTNCSSMDNTFSGPAGAPIAGSIGIDLTSTFAGYTTYNDKFDSWETSIKVSGDYQHILRPRFDNTGTYGVWIVNDAATVNPVVLGIASFGPTYALYDPGAKCRIHLENSSGGLISRIAEIQPFIIDPRGASTGEAGITLISGQNAYNSEAAWLLVGASGAGAGDGYAVLRTVAGGPVYLDNIKIQFAATTILKALFSDVTEYADNAAALAGGLVAGRIYRITGTDALAIVH